MEIEAKFNVPSREVFRMLQAIDRLAGFDLSDGLVRRVHDTYLDTQARRLFSAGYACRMRRQGDDCLITLKGLGGARDAIHRREELEAFCPPSLIPAQWPASPTRDRILELIGSAPLAPLFELQQERWVRNLLRGEQRIAELSLDDVRVVAAGREQTYLELEVELNPQTDETVLESIAACLRAEWKLPPQPRSKFERAISLMLP
ncbi:MAG TPA: CYTH domain-containing protein [Anaerolineales bacterium]